MWSTGVTQKKEKRKIRGTEVDSNTWHIWHRIEWRYHFDTALSLHPRPVRGDSMNQSLSNSSGQSQHAKICRTFIHSHPVDFLLNMTLRTSSQAKNSLGPAWPCACVYVGFAWLALCEYYLCSVSMHVHFSPLYVCLLRVCACVMWRQPNVQWHSPSQQPRARESGGFCPAWPKDNTGLSAYRNWQQHEEEERGKRGRHERGRWEREKISF